MTMANHDATMLGELTTECSSRRSLLRRGFALGLAAPLGAPVIRAFAQDAHDDEHGHGEASSPEAGGVGSDARDEDAHGGEGEHTEAPYHAVRR